MFFKQRAFINAFICYLKGHEVNWAVDGCCVECKDCNLIHWCRQLDYHKYFNMPGIQLIFTLMKPKIKWDKN